MKRLYYHIFTLLTLVLAAAACTDEIDVPVTPGEGVASVKATLTFQPLVGADVGSRADGQAIKYIDNLVVFIYNEAGVLQRVEKRDATEMTVDKDFKVDLPTGEGAVDGPGHQAEDATCRATFTIGDLGYGKYRIYAVANTPDVYGLSEPALMEKYKMLSELRLQKVKWDEADVKNNAQMFGYFTPQGAQESAAGFTTNAIVIDRNSVTLHAWLKRLASKVTVVYDGSGLHQGINIYIKSVTIKDIPLYCKLGLENKVGEVGQGKKIETDSLITLGETLSYNAAGQVIPASEQSKNWSEWLQVNKGNGLKGAVQLDESGDPVVDEATGKPVVHRETDDALYFYENVQGNFPGQEEYNKTPKRSEVGENITRPDQQDYKDRVPNGTYIEVEAYYVADNPMGENYESRGSIKYRFMLGMDTKYNYNAYRNHHYKLTLGFNGYANQPDWHIEYIEEDPFIETAPVFYMPYRYNQQSILPIRISGQALKVEAEIIENNWGPYSPNPTGTAPYDSVPEPLVGDKGDPMAFRWASEVYYGTCGGPKTYSLQNRYSTDGETEIETAYNDRVTPIFAGFMSIGVAPEYESWSTEIPAVLYSIDDGYEYSRPADIQRLKDNFYDNSLNYRSFDKDAIGTSNHSDGSGRNECVIRHLGDGSITFGLPLWTRQKNLLGISGFTGNNPYDTYQRKAQLKITATFDRGDGTTVTRERIVPVYQVRRVVNPKGVWRRHDDNTDFTVELLRRPDPKPETFFENFDSNGRWTAEIDAGDKGFITLQPAGGSRLSPDGMIEGDTGTPITFKIHFNGQVTLGTTRCAVVRVRYHGLTCNHTIFVRQGYRTPVAVIDGGAEWSSFNLYSCQSGEYTDQWPKVVDATVTQSPIALGSFFKRSNYQQGILPENNSDPLFGPLVNPGTNEFSLADGTTSPWNQIKGLACADNKGNITSLGALHRFFKWCIFKANVTTSAGVETRYYRVPSYEDFRALEKFADFGVGVLYADGAPGPEKDPDLAYGYTDPGNAGASSTAGSRGVFIYNAENGNQIFFPLGKNGMGRRTIQNSPSTAGRGMLRYSAVTSPLGLSGNNTRRPIPYNMPASAGGIYWILQNPRKIMTPPADGAGINPDGTTNDDLFAWDMNYFDFNFNGYGSTVVISEGSFNGYGGTGYGDALPIKLVRMSQAELDELGIK